MSDYVNSEEPTLASLGSDLSGADLSGRDFSGANLSNANLARSDLSGANLTGANLSGTNFTGANLEKAVLARANCSNTVFRSARLVDADLQSAFLGEADFAGADALCASFRDAAFSDHDWWMGDGDGPAKVVGASFRDADFRGADLDSMKFGDADISGANFDGAELGDADFRGCVLDSDVGVVGASAQAKIEAGKKRAQGHQVYEDAIREFGVCGFESAQAAATYFYLLIDDGLASDAWSFCGDRWAEIERECPGCQLCLMEIRLLDAQHGWSDVGSGPNFEFELALDVLGRLGSLQDATERLASCARQAINLAAGVLERLSNDDDDWWHDSVSEWFGEEFDDADEPNKTDFLSDRAGELLSQLRTLEEHLGLEFLSQVTDGVSALCQPERGDD